MEHRRALELSERESEIIELASHGHTDASIANQLGISEATVSTYWSRVRAKVGPFSRPEIIATIIREQAEAQIADLQHKNADLLNELQQRSWGQGGAGSEPHAYRELLDSVADAILILEENGRIAMADNDLCALFGYEAGELVGENLSILIPERFRREHLVHRQDFMAHPSKRKMAAHSVARGRRKDGTEFQIVASLSPIETADGTHVVCIVRRALRSSSK